MGGGIKDSAGISESPPPLLTSQELNSGHPYWINTNRMYIVCMYKCYFFSITWGKWKETQPWPKVQLLPNKIQIYSRIIVQYSVHKFTVRWSHGIYRIIFLIFSNFHIQKVIIQDSPYWFHSTGKVRKRHEWQYMLEGTCLVISLHLVQARMVKTCPKNGQQEKIFFVH